MGKKKSKKADESETEQKAKSKSGSKPKSSKTRQRSPSVAPPPEERRQSSRQKANKVAPIPTTKDTSKPSRKRANSEAAEGPSEHKNKKPKKPDGTRRIPSAIPAEDSDISMEDLAEKSQAPFQPPKKNVKVLEDFPTEDDKLTEEEDNDNMVEQSKEHDLTLLSKSKLKDTLSAERPSWGQSQHLGANAESKSEVLQKNTKDDNKKQNRKKKASSSGTSSESDSSSSDSTNSDSTNSDSSSSDSESSSSEKEATKPTLSKRAKNRLEEVPQWKPTKEQATKKSRTRSKSQKPKPDTGSDNEAPHPDNAKKAALLHINQANPQVPSL
ncbi:hypothetical protein CPB83DRAFT_893077 [Crepidotus variabilis]|uniref:Uncharacterized protein n=1 Tax=Crepidotus variabilis TaxID=179855 RepID=A0A9P6EIS9_9AGAR|nr:hypothetical protein CPB83DRAFT_893077 [Crepidotus variabilis]